MIKANVPSRIAFAVSSQTDSRVILDQNGAESLLGMGDMLFSPVGSSRLQRIQGAFIDEAQIEELTDAWRRQGEPELREDLLEAVEAEAEESSARRDEFDPDEDPLLADAIRLVAEMQTASTSMLQRRLRLGYTRAGRLIDMLERRGVISGYEGSKPRQVLVTEADLPRVLDGARRPDRADDDGARVGACSLGARMPEIGETLREARMRRRIDMTEVEAATKIRAKYLRALENEEWDLLPGPTFVKTFLRTYAEYLELDPRLLVEEYRQRYERPSTQDLTPFGPGHGRPAPAAAPAAAAADRAVPRRRSSASIVLLGALYLLGVVWGDTPPRTRRRTAIATATADRDRDAAKPAKAKKKKKKAAPTRVDAAADRRPTRVYVCVEDATGKAGRQRRVPRAGQEHQDVPLAALPRELRQRRRADDASSGKRYPAADIGAADRLRDAAGQEADAALGSPCATEALRDVSVRAGIIVTGTEVLSRDHPRRQRAVAVGGAARARASCVSHIVVVGDRPGRPALGAGLPLRRRRPGADQRRARADRRRPDRRRRGGVGGGVDGATTPALEERIWAVVDAAAARGCPGEEEAMRAGARKQAFVPAGAAVLEPVGTAPGLLVSASGPLVAVLPGPPRELQTMWEDAVTTSPLRELLASAGSLEQRILRFFPLPEPQIAATLREIDADALPLEITTCLRRGELEVATVFTPSLAARVRGVRGGAARAARRRPVLRRRRDDRRGRSRGCSPGATIATAESCTGGLMAGRLTDLAGSSAYVLGGLVVYSNEAKTALAGVPGVADRGARRRLARGRRPRCRRARARGWARTSGSASPASRARAAAREEKPVGTVCISV